MCVYKVLGWYIGNLPSSIMSGIPHVIEREFDPSSYFYLSFYPLLYFDHSVSSATCPKILKMPFSENYTIFAFIIKSGEILSSLANWQQRLTIAGWLNRTKLEQLFSFSIQTQKRTV